MCVVIFHTQKISIFFSLSPCKNEKRKYTKDQTTRFKLVFVQKFNNKKKAFVHLRLKVSRTLPAMPPPFFWCILVCTCICSRNKKKCTRKKPRIKTPQGIISNIFINIFAYTPLNLQG